MKLFVISDTHSFYNETKKALDEAGFDPNNPNHMLIHCGDALDRGNQSQEILDYFLSLPNAVFVRGNHESLFEQCCQRGFAWGYDFSNGTHKTICDLALDSMNFIDGCEIAYHKVKPLLNKMVNFYETEHYVFVHSTIPVETDWRNASYKEWDHSRWGNPFEFWEHVEIDGKTAVFGHWHTSWAWFVDGHGSEWGADACFDKYYGDGYIGIDACTAHSGTVNVLVLEDSLLENKEVIK